MPVFGFRSPDGSFTELEPDNKYLTRVSALRPLRVPKITAKLDGLAVGGSGDPQPVRGVLYDATNLLAQSEPVLIEPGAAADWIDFVFPDAGGILLEPGDYDIGLIVGVGGNPCARLSGFEGSGERFIGADTYDAVTTTTSEEIMLPTATIKVASTTGFDTKGTVNIGDQEVAYIGKEATKLTGCSGGTGAITSGTDVEQVGAASLRDQPKKPAKEVGEFSVFATYFLEATIPDIDDAQIARYPFSYAQSILGAIPPLEGSSRVATATWHGTKLSPERGSFVLVQREGEFSEMVGQRVKVSAFGGSAVFAYVLGEADLEEIDDLSLTRRLFMELAPLATESLGVRIEILSAEGGSG